MSLLERLTLYSVRRTLRDISRRLKRSGRTPNRKQTVTFGLVALPVGIYWLVGQHWTAAVLMVLVGVVLSTDYRVIDEYISSKLYEWIQDTTSLLDAVEQNCNAAEYAHQGYDPFELTYWEHGHFRATVASERPIHPGLRFLIRCEVQSHDEELTYPVAFCSAEVESVSTPSDGKREVKLNLVRWLDDEQPKNKLDQEIYREMTQKLRGGSRDISPTADLDESVELDVLSPDEWQTLYTLLQKTEIHEER